MARLSRSLPQDHGDLQQAHRFLDGLPNDIVFQTTPTGVTVVLGTPSPIDDPKFPTKVLFPFSFDYTTPPTTTANGTYTFIVTGAIPSPRMARCWSRRNPITFTLNDTTAPRVADTTDFSRIVTIQFTKAMNPNSITKSTVYVLRAAGGGECPLPRPEELQSQFRSSGEADLRPDDQHGGPSTTPVSTRPRCRPTGTRSWW